MRPGGYLITTPFGYHGLSSREGRLRGPPAVVEEQLGPKGASPPGSGIWHVRVARRLPSWFYGGGVGVSGAAVVLHAMPLPRGQADVCR